MPIPFSSHLISRLVSPALTSIGVSLCLGLWFTQCTPSQSESPSNPSPNASPVVAAPSGPSLTPLQQEAHALFNKRCSRCHGPHGDGQGPLASQFNPRPTNFTNPTWRAQVKASYVKRVIIGGGRAVNKSAMMPSHPDLRSNPPLLKALVNHVLQLAPPSPPPASIK